MEVPEAEPPLHYSPVASPAPAPAVRSLLAQPDAHIARLEGILEHNTISLDGGDVGCIARVTGHAQAGDATTPIDIAAAVDCSSSIRSAMPLIRRTMEFVVSELRSCDRLSIVCYHDEVIERLSLRSMDDAGKVAARAAIECMEAGGCTNLSGGIISAVKQLQLSHQDQADARSRAAAVFVLTDGLPTRGITNTAQLLHAVSAAHGSLGRSSCPISAFGFGESHDSAMLSSLAEHTEGTYCFIDDVDGIAPAFAECLGGMQSLVAQNVKLLIEPDGDASVTDVLSSYPDETSTPKVINFGDLRADEQKDVVIEVHLPVWLVTPGAPQPCLSLSLSFWDIAEARSRVLKQTVRINRENNIDSSPCIDVEIQRQRILVSRALLAAQQGSILAGRAALTAAQTALEASPAAAANCDLIAQLRRDLQQCLIGLADLRTYSDRGQHTLSSALSEHSRQRSSSGSLHRTCSYRTHSQSEAIKRASTTVLSGGGHSASAAGQCLQHQTQQGLSSGVIADQVRLRIDPFGSQRDRSLEDTASEDSQAANSTLIGGKYQLQQMLGSGGSGAVYRGIDVSSESPVAIKRMNRARIDCHHELLEQFRRELNISMRLDHPNVVRLMDVAFDSECVYLVQELAEGGDLFDLVSSVGTLPEARARYIFQQVASAVSYCHSQSVFHRDIKMENILLVTKDSDNVKLTDFGLAKDCVESFEGPKTMHVGTISFMAPEVAGYKRGVEGYEGAPVDVWGLGCTLFVMTTGEFPFGEDGRNVGRTVRRITAGSAGIDWELDSRGCKRTLSHPLIALLQGMLSSDPTDRLDVKDVVASEWVRGNGYAEGLSATPMHHQAPQNTTSDERAIRTVEWPEEVRSNYLPGVDLPRPSTLQLDDGDGDGFDIGLHLEMDTDLHLDTNVEVPSSSEHPAAPTSPPGDAASTITAGARARTVQFATSPCVITDSSATTVARVSRFNCSPIRAPIPDSCEFTAAVEISKAQASSPEAVLSQHQVHQSNTQQEAVQRRKEQVAADKLLAEQLAQSEKTDQRTLQKQMKQSTGEKCGDVFVIPDGLECPITNELFVDPVMCIDGHTYERAAILSWFEEQRKVKPALTSPMTNAVLESDQIFPNFALKKQCEAFAASPAYIKYMAKREANLHESAELAGGGAQQRAPRRHGQRRG